MKEFLENIERLALWFPSAESSYGESDFTYKLEFKDGAYAEVTLYVERDAFVEDFSMANALWHIRIYSSEGLEKTLMIAGQTCLFNCLQSLNLTVLDEEGVADLALFMELIWTDIFLRSIDTHGVFAGSWISGAILV